MSSLISKTLQVSKKLSLVLHYRDNYLGPKLIKKIALLGGCIDDFLKRKSKHFKKLPKSVKRVELGITICGKHKIRSLNSSYRQKDYFTDVLSFPIQDNLRDGVDERDFVIPQIELGDIFICYDVALAQARRFKISYDDEILHLIVHGFLHLCGFDHEISMEEEEIMQRLESKLLSNLSKMSR